MLTKELLLFSAKVIRSFLFSISLNEFMLEAMTNVPLLKDSTTVRPNASILLGFIRIFADLKNFVVLI